MNKKTLIYIYIYKVKYTKKRIIHIEAFIYMFTWEFLCVLYVYIYNQKCNNFKVNI